MKLLVFLCFFFVAEAAKLQGYSSQQHSSGSLLTASQSGAGFPTATGEGHLVGSSGAAVTGSSFGEESYATTSTRGDGHDENCPEGQLRHLDGTCVTPEITRNIYVYTEPEREQKETLPENIPLPKEEHNFIFIHTQDNDNGQDPIIIPPPQQKHIIYVLNKESEQGQRVIEAPSHPPQDPEVYFVNYADGETPDLPHGIDFEAALHSAVHSEGQFISGSSSNGNGQGAAGVAGISNIGGIVSSVVPSGINHFQGVIPIDQTFYY